MTDFKIKTDIPTRKETASKYPWEDIPVGGSFFVSIEDSTNPAAAASYRKARGESWVTRKATEDGVVGRRLWRTK